MIPRASRTDTANRTGMSTAPRGMRLHIGLFGRRNVGKSSVLNALTRQQVSIVSEQAGTTTDPVEKPMELQPLGPVLFIDTAGVDDEGALGELRVERTRRVLDRTDVAVVITDEPELGRYEEAMVEEFRGRWVPVIVVFNKSDVAPASERALARLAQAGTIVVQVAARMGAGLGELRAALVRAAPEEARTTPRILRDLVGPGELAVLVVPIDKEAPKGRLILPQVQSIRDLLDGDAMCLVVKESGLRAALGRLRDAPKLVVTDSQAFRRVAEDVPAQVPLTSFSILFARLKGDLAEQVAGTVAIDKLRPGDRVLVAKACTHHPIEEDIGRVKIPLWLERHVGGELRFEHIQGHDFPRDLTGVRLVVHCGACMLNRKEVQNRLLQCRRAGVPMTNYGLAIAYSLGLFERALAPFPAVLEAYRARERPGRSAS